MPTSSATPSAHTFAAEWRTDTRMNEPDLAGPACVLRFPSPLRRRYVAGPAFGLRMGEAVVERLRRLIDTTRESLLEQLEAFGAHDGHGATP